MKDLRLRQVTTLERFEDQTGSNKQKALRLRQVATTLERYKTQTSSNNVRLRLRQAATTLERSEAQTSRKNIYRNYTFSQQHTFYMHTEKLSYIISSNCRIFMRASCLL